jgi:hypothetical protein
MTILALSDIHGAYKRMMEVVQANPSADVIVIAGDLTTHGTAQEAETAIRQLQETAKPVLVVAGNMDPPELDDLFFRLGVSINGQGVIVDDVGFFGVSAAPLSPLMTPNEITEEEIALRAEAGWKTIAPARWKIFVPHAPPYNTRVDVIRSARHVGSTAVRAFIERFHPDAVLCGHIHEARGIDAIGTTKVINCGPVGQGQYGLIHIGERVEVVARP